MTATRACDSCGFANDLGDRWCGGCGVRLDAPAVEAPLAAAKRDELRTVTILMADLDGLGPIIESSGRERAGELMATVHERLARRHIVEAFDGYIDKLLDGDIMALFGAPLAHEDAPERAVRAAVRMHAELAAMHADGTIPAATPLRLRIGLNTGGVRVGGVGAEGRMEYTAMGDVVNLAARLMTACPFGSTLISEATHRRVARNFELEALEPITVKGKSEPQRVWAVLAEGRRAARLEIAASEGMARLIGRDELLAELRDAADAVAAGAGRVVGIGGEAGIGKSRLVYELRGLLGDQVAFLEGRCLSYGEHLSFTPIRDVLTALCAIRDSDSADQRRGKVQSTVAGLDCDGDLTAPLTFLLGLEPDDRAFAELEPRAVRDRLREAFCAALSALSRQRPLVLFVDDLQWCDVDSLLLLDSLVELCADLRLLLVAAYRPDFRHDWDRQPHYLGLRPRRLDPDETRQMIGALLVSRGVTTDESRVDDSLAVACFHKSQGNPFFVDQTITALLDRAEATGRPTVDPRRGRLLLAPAELDALVPDSVEEILLSRIDQLPAGPRALLQAASVAMIGRWFRLSALRETVGGLAGDNELRALQAAELIREEPAEDGDRRFSFEHALARDVAYHAMLRAERRRLHGLVGHYIERHYEASLEAYIDDLSHHYYHSDHADRAALYLPRSAERAARRYSNEQAKLHFRRAIEVLGGLGDEPPIIQRRLAVLRGLVQVYSLTGDPAQADIGEQRLALARAAGDRDAVIDASFSLAKHYTECGRFDQARAAWDEVLAGYREAGCHEGERDAELGIGQLCLLSGHHEEALRHFERATAIQVEQLPADPFGTWVHYNNLAAVYRELGRLDDALAAVDAADEALAQMPDGDPFRTRLQSYSAGNRGDALASRGRPRDAIECYRLTLADALATGERAIEVEVRYRLGSALLQLVDLPGAEAELEEAVAIATEASLTRWEGAARLGLAELARLRGDFAAADEQIALVRTLIERSGELVVDGEMDAVCGRLAGDHGDWATALALFAAAIETADRQHRVLLRAELLPSRARAAWRVGADRAGEAATQAVAEARRLGLGLVLAEALGVLAEQTNDEAAWAEALALAADAGALELELQLLAARPAERDRLAARLREAAVTVGEEYAAAARARLRVPAP